MSGPRQGGQTDSGRLYQWHVVGLPKAQGRPKFARIGNHVRAYDPQTSRDWKELVKLQIISTRPAAILDGPLKLVVNFRLPRPKSLPKRVLWHTKKPDVDNLVKAVKDAMKGIVYRDDSQVVALYVTKRYDAEPGVCIRLWDMAGTSPEAG